MNKFFIKETIKEALYSYKINEIPVGCISRLLQEYFKKLGFNSKLFILFVV